MGSVKKQAHFPYTVLGRPVCRHGFRNLHNLSYYMLNQSKDAITQNKGALTVHGNSMLNVQGARAEMMAAIRGVIYADCVKEDQEKVQTGATFVNMTLPTLIKLSHTKICDMWMNDELPSGDSKCRDAPPTEDLVKTAIKGLRNEFGTDIHFAKDSGSSVAHASMQPSARLKALHLRRSGWNF